MPVAGLLVSAAAQAALVPAGLSVSGSVTLDTVTSVDATGGATQNGTLRTLIGGVNSSASFGAIAPTSVSGSLTDIGDGFGVVLDMSAASNGATMQSDRVFIDYVLNLANTSATETYVVSFQALIENDVSASGADAFAQSMISIFDASHTEIEFSDHRVDTLNLGPGSNFTLDSAPFGFSITLAPGQTASFTAEQQQRGGVFAAGAYSANLDAFLRLDGVVTRGGTPVPLPSTLSLLALSLGLLAFKRKA